MLSLTNGEISWSTSNGPPENFEISDSYGHVIWDQPYLPDEMPLPRLGRDYFIRKGDLGMKIPNWTTTDEVAHAFRVAEAKRKPAEVEPYTYIDTQLDDLGLDAKDIREMSMEEFAKVRHALGFPDSGGLQLSDYWKSQVAISNERQAAARREAAMTSTYRTPIAPYDYGVITNSHPYHPENPFNVWRSERTAFIDGDDEALPRMLAVVCLDDWDRYDEVAHEDVEADRAKDAPAPVVVVAEPAWWRRCMVWRRNA